MAFPKLFEAVELLGVADDALKRLGVGAEVVDEDAAVLAEVGGVDPIVRNEVVVVAGRAEVVDGVDRVTLYTDLCWLPVYLTGLASHRLIIAELRRSANPGQPSR